VIIPLSVLAIVILPLVLLLCNFILLFWKWSSVITLTVSNRIRKDKMTCNLLWFYPSLYYVIVILPAYAHIKYEGSSNLSPISFHIFILLSLLLIFTNNVEREGQTIASISKWRGNIHYRNPALCRVLGSLSSTFCRTLGKDVFVECRTLGERRRSTKGRQQPSIADCR
jgi:hypothetical protein